MGQGCLREGGYRFRFETSSACLEGLFSWSGAFHFMKISVITASLNRKDLIRWAVQSVLDQRYSEFEHWIIDGGSTDGTLELLKDYPHVKIISEPDCGVYDAWNKGISHAEGDVISILNRQPPLAAMIVVS